MDLISQLTEILQGVASDPAQYLIVVFVYSIAAAVFLPFPAEAALFLSDPTPFWSIALVLSLGKTVGGLDSILYRWQVGGADKELGAEVEVMGRLRQRLRTLRAKIRLYRLLCTPKHTLHARHRDPLPVLSFQQGRQGYGTNAFPDHKLPWVSDALRHSLRRRRHPKADLGHLILWRMVRSMLAPYQQLEPNEEPI